MTNTALDTTKKVLPRNLFLQVTALVLAIRVCFLAWAFLVHPAKQASRENVLQIWSRWDGRHYIEIAEKGYEGKGLAEESREFNSRFPPLYPWLLRITSGALQVPSYLAGILVSLVSLVLASYLLFRLMYYEWGNVDRAWWAVCFLNVHPGSYFAQAVYAESLFLFLSATYLFALRVRKSPFLESVALGGLLLTRQAGLAFLALHGFVSAKRVLLALRKEPRKLPGIVLLAVLPVFVFGTFLLYQRYLKLPGYSGKDVPFRMLFPFQETLTTIARFRDWQAAWGDDFFLYTQGYSHLFFLYTAIIVALGIRLVPWEYSILGAAYVLMLSVMYWNIASIRYTFALLTTPIILSRIRNIWFRAAMLCIYVLLLGYFSWVFIVKYQLI